MNALKFFLSRFKDELGLSCADWGLMGSVFPELLDENRTKESKEQSASRYGDASPVRLLSYIANSPRLGDGMDELLESIATVIRHSNRGNSEPIDAMRRFTRRSGEESFAGVFESNLAFLSEAARSGGKFETAAKPFLVQFGSQKAKDEVRRALRDAWTSARRGNDDGWRASREKLWRWCVHDIAKDQLIQYFSVLATDCQRSGAILWWETIHHFEDDWNSYDAYAYDDGVEDCYTQRRGLGFVFSRDFEESFSQKLIHEFPYVDDESLREFWVEMRSLAISYDAEEDGSTLGANGAFSLRVECLVKTLLPSFNPKKHEDEMRMLGAMVDAVIMIVAASIVGPGSFFRELGRELPKELPTRPAIQYRSTPLSTVGARLQPIVLTGRRSDTYFTERADSVCIDKNDGIPIRIGRDPEWLDGRIASIRISDGSISRRHAEIVRSGGRWLLRDLGSKQGTLIIREPPKLPLRLYSPGVVSEAVVGNGDIIVPAGSLDAKGLALPLGIPGRAFRFEIEMV